MKGGRAPFVTLGQRWVSGKSQGDLDKEVTKEPGSKETRKIPFQIGVAESRFVKPLVKISKAGSHLLRDDCPINLYLYVYHNSNLI